MDRSRGNPRPQNVEELYRRYDALRAEGMQWQAMVCEAILGIDSESDPLAPAPRKPPAPLPSMGQDEDMDFDPCALAAVAGQ